MSQTEIDALSLLFARTLRLGHQVKTVSDEMAIVEGNKTHLDMGMQGMEPREL